MMIQRYYLIDDGDNTRMIPSEVGSYVLYDAVARLEAVNAKLRTALLDALAYADLSDAHYGPESFHKSLPWYQQACTALAELAEFQAAK